MYLKNIHCLTLSVQLLFAYHIQSKTFGNEKMRIDQTKQITED